MLSKVKRKSKPDGWENIEETLGQLDAKMRDIEASKDSSPKDIFRVHHQRSRYIFEMYGKKAISKELYDFCLREKIVDASLIAQWKKQGYEKLCCLRCIQPKETNYGNTCICRVPRKNLDANIVVVECACCGCKGCASCD